jgi:polysaccharide export outer membrane protein
VIGLSCALALACRPAPVTTMPATAVTRTALGPGDQISIKVFDEERFDREFEIEVDGTIDMPFIGAIAVVGRTPSEAAQEIELKLADGYLNDPHVTVVIKARSNREVSILGQVNEPGSLDWQERLTLVQAVSLAGGLTPFAATRRVKITRQSGSDGQTTTIELSLSKIIDGEAEDITLLPGDIVYVPESPI